jgi:hypothetical protein
MHARRLSRRTMGPSWHHGFGAGSCSGRCRVRDKGDMTALTGTNRALVVRIAPAVSYAPSNRALERSGYDNPEEARPVRRRAVFSYMFSWCSKHTCLALVRTQDCGNRLHQDFIMISLRLARVKPAGSRRHCFFRAESDANASLINPSVRKDEAKVVDIIKTGGMKKKVCRCTSAVHRHN